MKESISNILLGVAVLAPIVLMLCIGVLMK
jgi:predicted ATPase